MRNLSPLLLLLVLLGCSDSEPLQEHKLLSTAHAPAKPVLIKEATQDELQEIIKKPSHTIEVLSVKSAGGYTYVLAQEEGLNYWVAGPDTKLVVGQKLQLFSQMWMQKFNSKALGRDFDLIMFVENFTNTKQRAEEPKLQLPPMALLQPVKGGISIKELHANRDKYDGKIVTLHAKIIKTNFEIMKKNWAHIMDGSSLTNDGLITATTMEKNIKVDDEILLTGKVTINKDFGYGYFYKILIEDAKIKTFSN